MAFALSRLEERRRRRRYGADGIQILLMDPSRYPEVKWAQRSDKVYLTILLADAKHVQILLFILSIFCVINKAENGWWKKLLRGDGKLPHYIKVDWDKWVDADDGPNDDEFEGMDLSKLGNMGDMDGVDDFDDGDAEDKLESLLIIVV
ncbi:hypothetical protein KFK09_025891 [Dendrobium nobile]|uniref:Co-chaperone protein p23 n=1 Tax=Dendrobium nobile TaxID=94219 RepID=A0A8T3A6U8_DENNO|nr:hypothetical protein KFK09_025891 [Dendrobium nobile]